MAENYQYTQDLSPEFVFQSSRSSGPGGQNVNKVNTRIELKFDIPNSALLTDRQKLILLQKLASKLTSEGVLLVSSQQERSQIQNKNHCIEKIYTLINSALKPVKKRKPTKPTRSSIEKRIKAKKARSERKSSRGKIDF